MINHFQEMLKTTEIPQITNFYKRISDLIIKNGDFTIHSAELMNNNVGYWFKY
jgi:hypothetical protein